MNRLGMDLCPVCALTGHILQLQVIIRILRSGTLTPSVDWYCGRCRTTGHSPALTT